jgi:hypothetical protein
MKDNVVMLANEQEVKETTKSVVEVRAVELVHSIHKHPVTNFGQNADRRIPGSHSTLDGRGRPSYIMLDTADCIFGCDLAERAASAMLPSYGSS